MKYKAAILVELKKPLVIEEIETQPLRFGQVLVKILCSGICGAQINEIEGAKGPDKFLPHLLGHEATAVVMEIGEGVSSVKPGERVVCHWRKGAGLQAPPAVYSSKTFPKINSGWVTTFSEYSIVSENRVTRVPGDFDPEAGALFGCAVTTAMGVINGVLGTTPEFWWDRTSAPPRSGSDAAAIANEQIRNPLTWVEVRRQLALALTNEK
jgi:S-(hydroxymethyl)glutathione dehydrogenase/alcohol dehydrogenase